MSWQTYDNFMTNKIDDLGRELSVVIHCAVKYQGALHEKRIFVCKHDILFPEFAVQASKMSGDWSQIIERHNGNG